MKVCMSRFALFICISGSIFWNLTKLWMIVIIGYAVILPFYDFHLKHPLLLRYIQANISKCGVWILYLDFSYINCLYASLNTCGIKFIKLVIVWNISNLFFLPLFCFRKNIDRVIYFIYIYVYIYVCMYIFLFSFNICIF